MTIPARLHFCWVGTSLPWACVFAVLSAAECSGLPEIILHHTDALLPGGELSALTAEARVTLRRLDPIGCLREVGALLGVGDRLAALYETIDSPVKRTDILRAALLFRQGGIYLDLDTITVSSLHPLLDAVQFAGLEHIVWPHFVRSSRSPTLWGRSLILDLMRKAMRRIANGWRLFRQVERFYYRSVNNAVLGAEANTPLFARYLHAMLAVTPERLQDAYALGPDLLQSLLAKDRPADLVLHDPRVFYPLPPEISEHWFRSARKAELGALLSPETRVVHWYASTRSKARVALITPPYVREHRHNQLYSALVCASIPALAAADSAGCDADRSS